MKLRPRFHAAPVVAGLLLTCVCPMARAQNVGATPKMAERKFRVKNVPSDLIARWFDKSRVLEKDPKHVFPRPQPLPFMTAPLPDPLPGNINGPDNLPFPIGLDSLDVVDKGHSLRARGRHEAVEAFAKMLPDLDVPLRQIKVTASFYRINRSDFGTLGLRNDGDAMKDTDAHGTENVLGFPEDFNARLVQLLARKKGLLLDKLRVIVTDGSVGHLFQPSVTRSLTTLRRPQHPKSKDITYVRTGVSLTARVWRVSETDCFVIVEPNYQGRLIYVETTLSENEPLVIYLGSDKGQPLLAVTTFQFIHGGNITTFPIRAIFSSRASAR